MKCIVAGSRDVTDYELVKQVIKESGFEITEIISGTAKGVDQAGERYAKENNIPIISMPADWDKYGKRAGYVRNEEMARIGNALIAIRKNDSKGTGHMIDLAKKYNLKIFIKEIFNE